MNTTRKLIKSTLSGIALCCAAGTVSAADFSGVPSGAYVLDDSHAYINFQYNHLGLSNPSLSFDDFTVELNLNTEDPTQSTVNVSVDVASVVAGSAVWEDHITGSKWFDVASNPEITFTSTAVEENADGGYRVSGDLTVKGETQPFALDVTINGAKNHPMSGKPVVGLDASGELLRSAFGLGNNAPFISDEVQVSLSIEMKAVN